MSLLGGLLPCGRKGDARIMMLRKFLDVLCPKALVPSGRPSRGYGHTGRDGSLDSREPIA
jgi:hypothetical protein